MIVILDRHPIRFSLSMEMSRLTRDGRLNPSRETKFSGTKQKISNRKKGLLGKVGEGHDQKGGVMQRQVKMWLEHGPAPGNSI